MTSGPPLATIMVVDDTPANLSLLDQMLQQQGYEVLQFPRGDLALRAVAEVIPDLILLDIMMPVMDGFEVCRRLKANPSLRDIPVIFISALGEIDHKVQAFAEGGVDYVTKPFQQQEVLARVDAHLSIRALQQRLRDHNTDLEQLVAQRTEDLIAANARLIELDRLKVDFLRMIAHEVGTPASSVLSIGELLLDLCPESADKTQFGTLFRRSGERLRQLVEDAALVAEIDHQRAAAPDSSTLFDDIRVFPLYVDGLDDPEPSLRFIAEAPADSRAPCVRANPELLTRAFTTLEALARCFRRQAHPLPLRSECAGGLLQLVYPLDALCVPSTQTRTFFEIESAARASSRAQTLGLAPVVAERILTASGGRVRLLNDGDEEQQGRLQVTLPLDRTGATDG